MVKNFILAVTLMFSSAMASSETLKPFVLANAVDGDVASITAALTSTLTTAGFEVVGTYSPYDGTTIIAVTNDDLKTTAASSDMGGYGATTRVSVTSVNDTIQVTFTNPVYFANAYRNEDMSGAERALATLETTLGNQQTFGTDEKQLSANDLRKYHYMFGMEYFDDPSELASYDSQADALAAVEEGLTQARGGVTEVYRIDIPGKDETVFGVALNDTGCSGDEYIMSRIDKGALRSTGHLPYEILVSDGEVYALYARFRIAISWPHLPMIQSDTGATFFSIMCAPNAIEEALIEAAGGEL